MRRLLDFHINEVVRKDRDYELISMTDRLQEFPEFNRIVPEYTNADIREIILHTFRIVCRVNYKNKIYEIARVWHSASRGHSCPETSSFNGCV